MGTTPESYRLHQSSGLTLVWHVLPDSLASSFRIWSFLLRSWAGRSSLELLPSDAWRHTNIWSHFILILFIVGYLKHISIKSCFFILRNHRVVMFKAFEWYLLIFTAGNITLLATFLIWCLIRNLGNSHHVQNLVFIFDIFDHRKMFCYYTALLLHYKYLFMICQWYLVIWLVSCRYNRNIFGVISHCHAKKAG